MSDDCSGDKSMDEKVHTKESIEEALFTHSVAGDVNSIKFKPNTIITIPLKKIGKFSALTYLSLPHNNLRRINEDIFTLFQNLRWFDVRDNKLEEFPRFVGHKSLETILLGGNKLEKLPLELGSFEELNCVQVTGNPLLFPEPEVLEKHGIDLVSYLKLCWKKHTEQPPVKGKPTSKTKRKKMPVKREDSLLTVKHFANVANIVAEKMKSLDPIDQLLASHVIKKMRAIDEQLQKSKDQQVLQAWRDMYKSTQVVTSNNPSLPPYDIDPDYMTMKNRNDLKNVDLFEKKKKTPKHERNYINVHEELLKLDKELDSMKSRKPLSSPTLEKSQRLDDIRRMSEVLQKIKHLEVLNFQSLS